MSEEPLISIVTPSYNQAQFIEHNLRSILVQRHPNVEHLVIDGGSTDDTVRILRAYEQKYRLGRGLERNFGQSDAVVKGFRMSRGELVRWLNSVEMYFER